MPVPVVAVLQGAGLGLLIASALVAAGLATPWVLEELGRWAVEHSGGPPVDAAQGSLRVWTG